MAEASIIRLGTRGSQLARAQTAAVAARLRDRGHAVAIETITTVGDVRTDLPIAGLVHEPGGSDGVFVRELEQALLAGRIDAAVHSLKDLPTTLPEGLALACVPERVLPFDVLVAGPGATLATLPAGAVVGTSSIRRVVQVRRLRPDLAIRPIRGNVDTRLRKLEAGACDGLILAGAGLHRLGLAKRITEVLAPPAFSPAVAQGAVAVEIRAGDARTRAALAALDDGPAHAAVRAERACLAALAGGCLAPIGGWAREVGGRLTLTATVFEDDGATTHAATAELAADDDEPPEALGRRVAAALAAAGAADMLRRMRDRQSLRMDE
jgi:hydroxymethylbilane synthase